VLIKDASQHVVKKLSNQEVIKGPLDKLAKAKTGGMLFYREANLDPGQYSIAAVVLRQHNPAVEYEHQHSDCAPGRSGGPASEQHRGDQKSRTADGWPTGFADFSIRRYVGLSESWRARQQIGGNQLTLFVTVYTAKGDATAPKLSLEIDRAGHSVGHLSYDLHAPDQTGRIQYASVISLDKFQPGDYDLKLTVRAGIKHGSAIRTRPTDARNGISVGIRQFNGL